ncbi:MAG: ATP-binding protein [Desulfobacterales bacterium]|nr:ATP-binding protein [Desulfobacterales bacterium]
MVPRSILERLNNISLKNKIYFSTTVVIVLISVLIALFTRWILISTLTGELKLRGLGIARSIAESSRSFLLTRDIPNLTSLIFDARLGERRLLINYVYITDKQGEVVCHTFTRPFPEKLRTVNVLPAGQSHAIRLINTGAEDIYDVAVPVLEGLYEVGSVHIGLYKKHIDQLIGKLRTTFLGFISVVVVIFFAISHFLARYITRPIAQLTRLSDAISRGRFDIMPELGADNRCWELKNCEQGDCQAHAHTAIPCWTMKKSGGRRGRASAREIADLATECLACPVYSEGVKDEVRQLANSFINMTYHIKSSQAQLKESEEKYRSLFASGPNPIFVLDCRTREILDANPVAEEIYGYKREELVGRVFSDLGPLDLEPPTEIGRAYNLSPKLQYRRKDGRTLHVNVHACSSRYMAREVLIVATTDITEMVEKDSQLIQASKMKNLGEMSASIAHELNQPLNAIKMGSEYLEMMKEAGRVVPEQDLATVVAEISQQVDRATQIINRLRDFGRKSDLSKKTVDLNDAVRSVMAILGRQLKLQNIVVETRLAKTLPRIQAHTNRLEQVVFNLLTNARDAISQKADASEDDEEKRIIRVNTGAENGRVVLTVADNGAGIPVEVQHRIFESFFTTKEMGEGMGLGLAISLGIVEDYSGEIDVESHVGEGTRFRLTFPVAS